MWGQFERQAEAGKTFDTMMRYPPCKDSTVIFVYDKAALVACDLFALNMDLDLSFRYPPPFTA
jgi:hypothetical protein